MKRIPPTQLPHHDNTHARTWLPRRLATGRDSNGGWTTDCVMLLWLHTERTKTQGSPLAAAVPRIKSTPSYLAHPHISTYTPTQRCAKSSIAAPDSKQSCPPCPQPTHLIISVVTPDAMCSLERSDVDVYFYCVERESVMNRLCRYGILGNERVSVGG